MKYLVVVLNDGGGIGKSEFAKLIADIARGVTTRKVGLFDGDPKNRTMLSVFGTRNEDGSLQKPDENDLLEGCRVVDLRKPDASATELMTALEEIQPELIITDGAGGSDQNLGLMIMKSGTPEEFTALLDDLGYTLILASPQIPNGGGKTIEALTSTKLLADQYLGFDNVHFHIALNRWNGEIETNDDPAFEYWFKSATRKKLVEAGKLSETKILELPSEVMSVVASMPVPYSVFTDPEFAKTAGISIRSRFAIKKHKDVVLKQIEADPFLAKAYLGSV